MFTRIKKLTKCLQNAVLLAVTWHTSYASYLHFVFFYCCLAALFLLNKIKEGQMPQIEGGKVVYSGLEAGDMVCMNSDSEGDNVNLAEEFVSLDLDSEWVGEDGDVKNSEAQQI